MRRAVIDRIRVWQRSDGCCQDRLQDFTVSLLADNGQGLPGATLQQVSIPPAPTNSFAEILLPASDTSTLTKTGTGTLTLAAATPTPARPRSTPGG